MHTMSYKSITFNSLFEMQSFIIRSVLSTILTKLSILYLRCRPGPMGWNLALKLLSILYLRCAKHPMPRHIIVCFRFTFNSLFEMQPQRQPSPQLKLVGTFNSLFEMQVPPKGLPGPACCSAFNSLFEMRGAVRRVKEWNGDVLSILYLRCRSTAASPPRWRAELSILYLRCGEVAELSKKLEQAKLSILYLRCTSISAGQTT